MKINDVQIGAILAGGRLKVIEFIGKIDGRRYIYWKCECLNAGIRCNKYCVISNNDLSLDGKRGASCCGDITCTKRFNNLLGQTFGRLFVVQYDDFSNSQQIRKHARWWCQCECGNELTVRSNTLLDGETKSCGCLQRTGFMGISGSYFGQIKAGAKLRHYEFAITIEYMWEQFQKQNGRCALTGWDIILMPSTVIKGTASFDRIDSSIGYVPGNVQWVHKDVNKMKNAFAEQRLLEICSAIIKHRTNNL